jgi:ribose/xylose/arabinose/galactoside ABC-type transport system permease subunit
LTKAGYGYLPSITSVALISTVTSSPSSSHVSAYVLCSLFAAAGGIMLAAQVGVGDPTIGTDYTLTSITAVVLGGAGLYSRARRGRTLAVGAEPLTTT